MDKVQEIGETIMKTFVLSWPTSFNAPIIKEVKTKQLMKKHVGVGAIRVHTKSGISNSRTFLGGKQFFSRTFPARHPHISFTILSTEPFRFVKQGRSQKLVL